MRRMEKGPPGTKARKQNGTLGKRPVTPQNLSGEHVRVSPAETRLREDLKRQKAKGSGMELKGLDSSRR